MKLRFSITPKLTLIFVLFGALVVAAVGLMAYDSGRVALQAATTSELLTSAIEKQAALNAWVRERQNGVAALAKSPDMIREVSSLVSAQKGSIEAREAHDDLLAHFMTLTGDEQPYLELMVLEPVEAQVLASTDPIAEGTFKERLPYFIHGKTGPFVQNLYFSGTLNTLAMTVSAPMVTLDGRVVGVLAGRLHLEEMTALISRRTGLHQTDEAFLVHSSSLFATQPRLMSDPVVMQRGIHTTAVTRCLQRTSGVAMYDDYRGVPVLEAYRWLPESQLCLIVKMDQAEALAPSRAFGRTILLVGFLILLVAGGLAFWVARTITQPVHQLLQGAEQLGQGNLDYRIQTLSRDEIGVLGREFNRMAASVADKEDQLRKWASELEERVAERTAELSASEERFRKAVDGAPFPIMLHAEDGQVLLINQAWTQLTGYTQAEIPTTDLWALKAYGEARRPVQEEIARTYALEKPTQEGEYSITTAGGASIVFDFSSAPLGSLPDGRRLVISMAMDVTARKQAEDALVLQALELTRSNTELERFAYIASHDLQEPLRMVTSYMQLLERRYKEKLDGDALEFIAYAVDGSNRMKTLINDLLAYSRVGTHGKNFHSTDCEAVLQHALANLKVAIEENQAQISHDPLPQVLADEVQLEQVFQNLVGNALKFRGSERPQIHIGLEREENYWVFSVRDNGIGIDPQYFERIFIIFQRLHTRSQYEGTGIGLAISKRIVERHGGRIWVESQSKSGSTFCFSIPVPGEGQP